MTRGELTFPDDVTTIAQWIRGGTVNIDNLARQLRRCADHFDRMSGAWREITDMQESARRILESEEAEGE